MGSGGKRVVCTSFFRERTGPWVFFGFWEVSTIVDVMAGAEGFHVRSALFEAHGYHACWRER
jgi:hypothetical protein